MGKFSRGSRVQTRRASPVGAAGPLAGFKDILCRVQASRVNYLAEPISSDTQERETIALFLSTGFAPFQKSLDFPLPWEFRQVRMAFVGLDGHTACRGSTLCDSFFY